MFRAARPRMVCDQERAGETSSHMAQEQSLSRRITAQQATQTRLHAAKESAAKLDEGAYFGLHTDWGDGTNPAVENSSRKGMFFGLHTDWGNGTENSSQENASDEGAFFGLHTDWGDETRNAPNIAAPDKGAYFGLHTDWGKSR